MEPEARFNEPPIVRLIKKRPISAEISFLIFTFTSTNYEVFVQINIK